MAVPAPSCPSENDLVDYVAHAPGAAAVEPHLDVCPVCRATVAGLLDLASVTGGEGPASPPVTEEPAALLPPGARVGRYVVVELVGAGAMGTVYAARDPDLERAVALKLLRPELGRGPQAEALRARLSREAKALARISHPNVITVLDTGAIGDQLFVAMELVSGGTLRAWLREAPRSWAEILGAYRDAGRGLAAAHAAGIVHRDFKPDNVLVGADGRVRVTDFGLSLAGFPGAAEGGAAGDRDEPGAPPSPGTPTVTSAFAGTPAYMAPEQLAGGGAAARSDLFSFCVALHEALYGTRPFAGSSLAALRVSLRGPVPPAPAGTKVPPWIRRVLLRGLSPDPEARYPSMAALLDALARDPVSARRRAAGGALVAALLGVAAVLAWLVGARTRAPTCEGVAADEAWLAGVWDAPRRAAVKHALTAARAPGADAWPRTERAIDGWAKEWTAMRRDVCLATRARGEPPGALLEARLACLERRLDGVRATVDVLARADEEVVDRSADLSESLPHLGECAGTAALLAPVAAPPPAAAAGVRAARHQLDDAEAAGKAGHYDEALALASVALSAAKGLGYAPLLADAQIRVGIGYADLRRHKLAADAFLEAVLAAEAARDDAAAANAWTRQVRSLAYDARFDEAHRAAKHAAALLARFGGGAKREADVENSLGVLALSEGHFADALAHYQRALTLREQIGANGFTLGTAHLHLGAAAGRAGDSARAEAEQRTAVRLYTEALGPSHPAVVAARRALAATLPETGKIDEAVRELRALLVPCEGARAASSPLCADIAAALGQVLLGAGETDEAVALLQRAIDVLTLALGPDHARLAHPLTRLGDAYLAGGHAARALAAYQRAVAVEEKANGPEHLALAAPLTGIGRAELALGAADRARAPLERALALRQKEAAPADRAETELALADALWTFDARRARALGEAAAADGEAAGHAGERSLTASRAWLAAHPAPR